MTKLHYLTLYISGPHITPGKQGNAIFTPNTGTTHGNVIDLGTHENDCLGSLSLCPNGVTLSLWFKIDSVFSWPMLMSSTYFVIGMDEIPGAPGSVKVKSHSLNVTHEITYYELYIVQPNVWTHFALTYNVNSGYEFFQDGCKLTKESKNTYIKETAPVIKNFELGCSKGSNCVKFAYDDFKFWSTAKDEQFMWWLANG